MPAFRKNQPEIIVYFLFSMRKGILSIEVTFSGWIFNKSVNFL